MELLTRLDIWRLLTWLPKWILRRKYSEQRIAALVAVDLRPRNYPATVNLCSTPTYDLWFQIINMSPFEVELDRAQIEFICAGTTLETSYIQRKKIKPGDISEIFVTGDIPEGKADAIAQRLDQTYSSVSINMDFNCILHSFSKQCRNLEGVVARIINHGERVNKT
ncbi:MAG: hypothetical protein OXU27_12635 [Candidatus Poribacteria bacterium]|nr:hypothetical protein [Candidatus Poribacteria bacterium]